MIQTNRYMLRFRVLTTEIYDLMENPKICLIVLEKMNIGTREKGSISRDQKFKSPQGIWFGLKK